MVVGRCLSVNRMHYFITYLKIFLGSLEELLPRCGKVSPNGGSQQKTPPRPQEWKEWEVPGMPKAYSTCYVPGIVLGVTRLFIYSS